MFASFSVWSPANGGSGRRGATFRGLAQVLYRGEGNWDLSATIRRFFHRASAALPRYQPRINATLAPGCAAPTLMGLWTLVTGEALPQVTIHEVGPRHQKSFAICTDTAAIPLDDRCGERKTGVWGQSPFSGPGKGIQKNLTDEDFVRVCALSLPRPAESTPRLFNAIEAENSRAGNAFHQG